MYIRLTLIVFLAFVISESRAQFWKKKKKQPEAANAVQQPTSLDPLSEEHRALAPKASRKASKGPTYGLEEEFYDRMEELVKVRKKTERLMEKPQYSNPLYFGHKRPPKKRKPSKMKFCKECGIRH